MRTYIRNYPATSTAFVAGPTLAALGVLLARPLGLLTGLYLVMAGISLVVPAVLFTRDARRAVRRANHSS